MLFDGAVWRNLCPTNFLTHKSSTGSEKSRTREGLYLIVVFWWFTVHVLSICSCCLLSLSFFLSWCEFFQCRLTSQTSKCCRWKGSEMSCWQCAPLFFLLYTQTGNKRQRLVWRCWLLNLEGKHYDHFWNSCWLKVVAIMSLKYYRPSECVCVMSIQNNTQAFTSITTSSRHPILFLCNNFLLFRRKLMIKITCTNQKNVALRYSVYEWCIYSSESVFSLVLLLFLEGQR